MLKPFDVALEYQISVFFAPASGTAKAGEPDGIARDAAERAVKRLGNSKAGAGLLPLSKKVDSIRVQALDGSVPTSDGLQWYSRNSVWRITWIPSRIDLRFDASTFGDLKEGSDVDVPALAESVGAAMEEMVVAAEVLPSRLALVATGTISAGADGVRAIAAAHLNQAAQTAAEAGQLLEAQVRLNSPADWQLGNGPVRVNRMLTKHAQWKLNAGEEERDLVATFDVNTSPTHPQRLSAEDVRPFMKQAAAWIAQQIGGIGV